jgi:hypothetical protein
MHEKTCFCGKLKIKTPERPLLHFVCHCKDCDALWNGLYMGLVFPTDEIELSGEPTKLQLRGWQRFKIGNRFLRNMWH